MEKRLIIAMGLLTAVMLGIVGFSLLTLDFQYLAGSENYSLPAGEPGMLLAGAIIVAMALVFCFHQADMATPRYMGSQRQRPAGTPSEYSPGADVPAGA